MKRLLAGALAFILSFSAFAQSYPSPTLQNLTVLGTFTASGKVSLPSLASQAANTVVANVTGSSASPTAVAMPNCNTAASALNYTTSTGFTCNTSVNAAQLGGTAAASYALLASPTFTGVPAAPTASATTNTTQLATTAMVNSAVTGGSLAGSFTTLRASSTITPSSTAGIVGTTAADNAQAGSDGEWITNTASGVSLSNNVVANLTSISLTAGDWYVFGTVSYSPAATTTVTGLAGGVSQTSATLDTQNYSLNWTFTTGTSQTVVAPANRYNVSTTTTIYLVARSSFGTSTMTAGGTIFAWRRR